MGTNPEESWVFRSNVIPMLRPGQAPCQRKLWDGWAVVEGRGAGSSPMKLASASCKFDCKAHLTHTTTQSASRNDCMAS